MAVTGNNHQVCWIESNGFGSLAVQYKIDHVNSEDFPALLWSPIKCIVWI